MKASPFILMTFLSTALALPAMASPIPIAEDDGSGDPPVNPPRPAPDSQPIPGDCGAFEFFDYSGDRPEGSFVSGILFPAFCNSVFTDSQWSQKVSFDAGYDP